MPKTCEDVLWILNKLNLVFHLGKKWLRQKLSRFIYKNPDITALRYGTEMEAHVAENFKKVRK